MRSLPLSCFTTIVAACLAAPAASAATVERQELYMSVSRCQPSLPAFDGAIRKRPLAMQNEGTGPAFITCGLDGLFYAQPSKKFITVGLANTSGAAASVTCTLVDGRPGFSNPAQFTKSVTIGAGSASEIIYSAADNGGENFIYPATSCNLPPGTGITFVGARFDEDIGN